MAALLLLLLSAVRPVGASSPADVELAGYDGMGSGQWACGPKARVRYAGIGGRARFFPSESSTEGTTGGGRQPELEHGLAVTAGVAVEGRGYRLLACYDPPCSVPPESIAAGGFALLGYDGRIFAFHAGPLLWQRFVSSTDSHPAVNVFPDIEFRLGRVDRLSMDFGLGSYDAPTILRPGGYLGLAWAVAPGWQCALHGGVHATFDGDLGIRASFHLRAPLTQHVQVGFGFAGSTGARDGIEPEGQVLVDVHL